MTILLLLGVYIKHRPGAEVERGGQWGGRVCLLPTTGSKRLVFVLATIG